MTRTILCMTLVTSGLMLVSCSGGAQRDDATAQVNSTVPPGVSVEPGIGHAGIYPAEGEKCCWLADDAKFSTRVPPSARRLAFTVFVPNVAPIAKQGERMSVSIDGKQVQDVNLRLGTLATVAVPLRGAPHSGDYLTRVELRMSNSYVPKSLGLNDDVRRLSVLLGSVSAE